MATNSQRPKARDDVLSSLNVAIDALNLAEVSSITPVKAVFGPASVLLTEIKDSVINEADYVELGLTCAGVCKVLARGTDGKRVDQLSRSVLKAIKQLTTTVTEIRRIIIKQGKRNAISRLFHTKRDKETIATWRLDLNRILDVFNTELGIDIHATVSDNHHDTANAGTAVPDARRGVSKTHPIVSEARNDVTNTRNIVSDGHRNTLRSPEDTDGRNQVTHASTSGESPPPLPRDTHGTDSKVHRDVVNIVTMTPDVHRNMLKGDEDDDGRNRAQDSIPGESPPPPPRVFFGRDDLVEKIVGFAENLTPVALIGAGGIGKTSTALTVLHDDRIKRRFGDDRRFIRCDQFPASLSHFLRRLSKVIGAGIENPEDPATLRPFLSSKNMLIVLDNAESILDLQGTSGQEIYAAVDELSQFDNICLCITSRISTIPPHCETLDIPTLSMEAGCDTFYRIYKHGERSDLVNNILEQLDFHPLSITLLATVAQHSKWDTKRLSREWERQRTGVLDTRHSGSLATAIELSLASATFQELGPDARGLLGVVAFFPQGVDENNLDWLFPTISDVPNVFDKFCILSLTYRSDGFTTMLAPLRDYFRPKDPKSSPLLTTTKECYFTRLLVNLNPNTPGFGEGRWITSEDTNVEHLLDVFTLIEANSNDVWNACTRFMHHLYWHKPRLVVLGPRIEALPDDHPFKPLCLRELSQLFESVGNQVERKRLLTHALKLWRDRGDDDWVAAVLSYLSDANRLLGLFEEGIQQAKEGLEIFERLGDTANQGQCSIDLAWLLWEDKQLDAAEETASCAINLLSEKDQQFRVCKCHHVLGYIYSSKGETGKAVHHLEVALGIASSFNWSNELFWTCFCLARLFFDHDRFDDAQAHIERAKSHVVNNKYFLGRAMQLQADIWYRQDRLEQAKSECLRAVDVYEKLGATRELEMCRELLQGIDDGMKSPVASDESDDDDWITESE